MDPPSLEVFITQAIHSFLGHNKDYIDLVLKRNLLQREYDTLTTSEKFGRVVFLLSELAQSGHDGTKLEAAAIVLDDISKREKGNSSIGH